MECGVGCRAKLHPRRVDTHFATIHYRPRSRAFSKKSNKNCAPVRLYVRSSVSPHMKCIHIYIPKSRAPVRGPRLHFEIQGFISSSRAPFRAPGLQVLPKRFPGNRKYRNSLKMVARSSRASSFLGVGAVEEHPTTHGVWGGVRSEASPQALIYFRCRGQFFAMGSALARTL